MTVLVALMRGLLAKSNGGVFGGLPLWRGRFCFLQLFLGELYSAVHKAIFVDGTGIILLLHVPLQTSEDYIHFKHRKEQQFII